MKSDRRPSGTAVASLLALAFLAASLTHAAPAAAVTPDLLLQIPPDSVLPGEGAGELFNPRGMVADPDTGHLYVSELSNSRISEFTAWGGFVKAWGWDVAPEGAPGDTPADRLEVCTATCKAGTAGNGAGQLNLPTGIALDANGDLYAYEGIASKRVQKFAPDGSFLLMFGGEVNKTTGADVCSKADLEGGEECGAGVSGTADGWFSNGSGRNHIAYDPLTDSIFVGDKDRIEEFNLDGTFKAKIDFEGELQALDGGTVAALAADPCSGALYLSLSSSPPKIEPIYKIDPSGTLLDDDFAGGEPKLLEDGGGRAPYPTMLATDADCNLYVAISSYSDNAHNPQSRGEVVGLDAAGNELAGMERGAGFAASPGAFNETATLQGLATNVLGPGSEEPGDLYVSYFNFGTDASVRAFGPPPLAFEDPPSVPPTIEDQYAVSVDSRGATLRAQINPRFWTDATYYVQYGTKACPEAGWEGPACKESSLPPGEPLSEKSINAPLRTAGVLLRDLEPDTTYHYRFVAQSSGGGPVFGVGGEEKSFKTFPLEAPTNANCPNQALRSGPAAKLPDCRAYELVSPLEKNNGDATLIGEANGTLINEYNQSALSGEKITYPAKQAFGEVESSPYVSQYISDRDPAAGWSTHSISPPRTERIINLEGAPFNDYQAFSPDLCAGWLRHTFKPTLAPEAAVGFPNLYRRDNCGGSPGYEALTTAAPANRDPEFYVPLIQGFSADGSHAIFNAAAKLTAEAPALVGASISAEVNEPLLYEHVEGEAGLRFVCILPNKEPVSTPCGAGTPAGVQGGWRSNLQGAISADGSRIFWTAFSGSMESGGGHPGRIYLRIDGAKTIAVSQSASAEPAWFWGAAEDGSRAIFEVTAGPLKDNLYEFDVEAEEEHPIAGGVLGMAGMSEDASRLYLASKEVLTGEQANSEGDVAVAGKPNLYLYEAGEGEEGGAFTFIGTLDSLDLNGTDTDPATGDPVSTHRSARVSADGRHAAFTSVAPLTGYDNADAEDGRADLEVFLYDAEQAKLRCVSCNPSGARPTGKRGAAGGGVAARIPAWERPLYASRVLSEDGKRLFFESYDALVPADGNGVLDVYEWEAPGTGDCTKQRPTYSEDSEGCVGLISSGQSPTDSRFLDADPSGEDVFIGTLSSLVGADYGLIDVYDARIGGGFPEAKAPPSCEGEACQSPPGAPSDPTPASQGFRGAGNAPPPTRTRCPKGKRRVARKGAVRCAPRKGRRAKHRRAGADRRAPR
jgi:hypothetical protein